MGQHDHHQGIIMHTFFAVFKPDEINGKLAAIDGKLLVHIPNYFLIYRTPPAINDGVNQVYQLQVPDDMFAETQEGDVLQARLWQGAKGERTRVGCLVTLEVATASQDNSDLPSNVQLAAAIVANSDVVPAIAGRTGDQVREWAHNTLNEFAKG